jgi:hypothetical protein
VEFCLDIPILLKKISANTVLSNVLTWPFDFEVVDPYLYEKDYDFILKEKALFIAKDGTGSIFGLYGSEDIEHLPVLYINTEGQAGFIAKNFNELIFTIVSSPFWRDLLKFSGDGQLKEMRKVYPLLNKEWLDLEPELNKMRKEIFTSLSLDLNLDSVESLYKAMKSEPDVVISTDGKKYDSLFGLFISSDNPKWR